jgi:excisionase family DNA binding protein
MEETTRRSSEGLPRLLTAQEVAEHTTLPLATVYALARGGALPCVRLGRAMRFSAAAVMQWVDAGGTRSYTRGG